MAAPCSKCPYERFFNFYKDLISICEEKRRLNEAICEDYRKLFKPWPKAESSEEKNNVAISVEQAAPTEQQHGEDESGPTDVERTQLAMLDDILCKAATIRMSQVKVKKKEAPILGSNDLNNTQSIQAASSIQTVKPSQTKGSTIKHNNVKTPGLPYTRNAGVIKQSHLNKLKQERTSLKYKPAHQNAPFKTEKTSTRPKSGGHRPKTQGLSESKIQSAPPSVRLKQTKPDNVNCNNQSEKVNERIQRNSKPITIQQLKECPSHVSPNILHQQTTSDVSALTSNTSSTSTDIETNNTPELHVHSEKLDDKVFLLQEHIKNIPMPAPLKRHIMKNYSLRNKVMTCLSTKGKNGSNIFLRRMELSLNHVDISEICSPSEDILRVTQKYNMLEGMLDGLCLQDSTFTEDSDCRSLLRCKMYLEYILKTFDNLEGKYQELCKDEDQVKQATENIKVISKKFEKIETNSHNSSVQGKTKSKDVHIGYSTKKDIIKYVSLKHNQMVFKTNLDILHFTGILLKDAIKNPNTTHQLYRCIKSLVESIGEQFPVLVADN